jgi:CrcB protein
MMERLLGVALGGALGSLCRYGLGGLAQSCWGARFACGTLSVNVLGCFLMGLVMSLSAEGGWITPAWRLWLATGFLGGFTTFSAFGHETLSLAEAGELTRAGLNVLANVVFGLASTWGGLAAGRLILGAGR